MQCKIIRSKAAEERSPMCFRSISFVIVLMMLATTIHCVVLAKEESSAVSSSRQTNKKKSAPSSSSSSKKQKEGEGEESFSSKKKPSLVIVGHHQYFRRELPLLLAREYIVNQSKKQRQKIISEEEEEKKTEIQNKKRRGGRSRSILPPLPSFSSPEEVGDFCVGFGNLIKHHEFQAVDATDAAGVSMEATETKSRSKKRGGKRRKNLSTEAVLYALQKKEEGDDDDNNSGVTGGKSLRKNVQHRSIFILPGGMYYGVSMRGEGFLTGYTLLDKFRRPPSSSSHSPPVLSNQTDDGDRTGSTRHTTTKPKEEGGGQGSKSNILLPPTIHVTTFVLKYSTPPIYPSQPSAELALSIELVATCPQLFFLPSPGSSKGGEKKLFQYGVIGFSAGGHLAATYSAYHDTLIHVNSPTAAVAGRASNNKSFAPKKTAAESKGNSQSEEASTSALKTTSSFSFRLQFDFLVLCYPVISMKPGVRHEKSAFWFLWSGGPAGDIDHREQQQQQNDNNDGEKKNDLKTSSSSSSSTGQSWEPSQALIHHYSLEYHPYHFPKVVYIWHALDDEIVSVENSQLMHDALRNVSSSHDRQLSTASIHSLRKKHRHLFYRVYPKGGGHAGWGMPSAPEAVRRWMDDMHLWLYPKLFP